MKDTQPQAIYLNDYQIPDFLIKKTDLVFELKDESTRVVSTLLLEKNLQSSNNTTSPLVLHGQELELESIAIDGRHLDKNEYSLDEDSLTLVIPDRCIVTCITIIQPQMNTSLEGLYRSSSMYCTQCEAEGFRKITYYLDRPDVMSNFTTKIIADKDRYPVLLSNGNLVNQGQLDDNRHWAQWHDPFKKPSYLFALVAGQLSFIEDSFTTMSGRDIVLRIYVEEKDLDKCDYAMLSLKNSMLWDEQVYGREYDLDIFMIVAVDDFNMGAMENKGLNIFNTACVLAKPETTTDSGFQRVEGIVAHEYFHNWSGNRVTCRDWFQLSLKEGFTVFRDQEFSADMGSAAVKRIEDVTSLRTLQFAEDAGPMAHPVQPASFIEISNFYTLTVYEKGAEVVRMLHTLLGAETFRLGCDEYFKRYDGQAVTINEFISAMESASGRDLRQFKYWYTQAGTPILTINDHYDPEQQQYTLTIKQHCPTTPEAEAEKKQAYHLPLAVGLIGEQGSLPFTLEQADGQKINDEISSHKVLELTQAEHQFTFSGVTEKPVPSLLRNFSAPVRLIIERKREDYLRLMCYDDDSFSRWDATQQLAVRVITDLMTAYQQQQEPVVDKTLIEGLKIILADTTLDKSMVALLLTLPSSAYLAEIAEVIDVDAIQYARNTLRKTLAVELSASLQACYQQLNVVEEYQATAEAMARRALKNTALDYMMLLDDPTIAEQCYQQFTLANNMTDKKDALTALVYSQADNVQEKKLQALVSFYEQWQHEPLVVNDWLSVQASVPSADTLSVVKDLMKHPCFTLTNPNKVRALLGSFARNMVAFHQSSGEGYHFLGEQIIALNRLNPQIAARMLTPLTRWRKYDKARQEHMRAVLVNIRNTPNLSKDVFEVVDKSL